MLSQSDFYPRYETPEHRSHEESIYAKSTQLPVILRKNYSVLQADLLMTPTFVNITTDSNGYRNTKQTNGLTHFDEVFVGDSATFGYGVDMQDTFVYRYGQQKQKAVYNLSIPNTGPETFMYIIDEFLKTRTTDRINLMFYEANDFGNLDNSYWPSMFQGQIPAGEKITRKDMANKTVLFSDIMHQVPFKYSKLSFLLKSLIDGQNGNALSQEDFIYLKKLLVGYLKQAANTDLHSDKVTAYIDELKAMDEVMSQQRLAELVTDIDEHYRNNNRDGLLELTQELAVLLDQLNINPISPTELVNIGNYLHSRLGFGSNNKIDDGYDALVKLMVGLLSANHDEAAVQAITAVKPLLAEYQTISSDDMVQLSQLLDGIGDSYQSKVKQNITLDEKLAIMFNYLKSLQDKGINITLYGYTGEWRMKWLGRPNWKHNRICDLAAEYNIECVNMVPDFLAHYHDELNRTKALYMDGAHFNRRGHQFILDRLLPR